MGSDPSQGKEHPCSRQSGVDKDRTDTTPGAGQRCPPDAASAPGPGWLVREEPASTPTPTPRQPPCPWEPRWRPPLRAQPGFLGAEGWTQLALTSRPVLPLWLPPVWPLSKPSPTTRFEAQREPRSRPPCTCCTRELAGRAAPVVGPMGRHQSCEVGRGAGTPAQYPPLQDVLGTPTPGPLLAGHSQSALRLICATCRPPPRTLEAVRGLGVVGCPVPAAHSWGFASSSPAVARFQLRAPAPAPAPSGAAPS